MWACKTRLSSSDCDPDRFVQEIVGQMRNHCWSSRDIYSVNLAVVEGISNAVCHGNKSCPDKFIEVSCEVESDHVSVVVRDEGEGFSLSAVEDPRASKNLLKLCGRGIFLISGFMSSVSYNDRGNELRMCKYRTEEFAS